MNPRKVKKLLIILLLTTLVTISLFTMTISFPTTVKADSSAPGLPEYARSRSSGGAALSDVEQIARTKNLGEVFVKTVKHLAQTESGATYARPAIKFDARPPSQRPSGTPLITAWGVFQFNRDAWTSLIPCQNRQARRSWIPKGTGGCAKQCGCVFPWDSTPEEEIAFPIGKYEELFSEVRNAGGSEVHAARGVRLWHVGSGIYRQWLNFAKLNNFDQAWRNVNQFDPKRARRNLKIRIDNHLRNADVL